MLVSNLAPQIPIYTIASWLMDDPQQGFAAQVALRQRSDEIVVSWAKNVRHRAIGNPQVGAL